MGPVKRWKEATSSILFGQLLPWVGNPSDDSHSASPVVYLPSRIASVHGLFNDMPVIVHAVRSDEGPSSMIPLNNHRNATSLGASGSLQLCGFRIPAQCRVLSNNDWMLRSDFCSTTVEGIDSKRPSQSKKKKGKKDDHHNRPTAATTTTAVIASAPSQLQNKHHPGRASMQQSESVVGPSVVVSQVPLVFGTGTSSVSAAPLSSSPFDWCPHCRSLRCGTDPTVSIGANASLLASIGQSPRVNATTTITTTGTKSPTGAPAPTTCSIILATLLGIQPGASSCLPVPATRVNLRLKEILPLSSTANHHPVFRSPDGAVQLSRLHWSMFDTLQTSTAQAVLFKAVVDLMVSVSSRIKVVACHSWIEFEVSEIISTITTASDNLGLPEEGLNTPLVVGPAWDDPSVHVMSMRTCPQCHIAYPPIWRIDAHATTIYIHPPSVLASPATPSLLLPSSSVSFPVLDLTTPHKPQGPIGMSRVGGLGHIVKELKDLFITPLMFPEVFIGLGIRPPKGVLLYGPPGTGKSLLAKSLAEEIEVKWEDHWKELCPKLIRASLTDAKTQQQPPCPSAPVIEILSGGEMMSRGRTMDESGEEGISAMFRRCRSRLESSGRGTLLFVDEIDALCPDREHAGEMERRIVATFLTNLDGLQADSRTVLLCATNRPQALDPALRRAGRLDREIEVDVPNGDDRVEILLKILEPMHHSLTKEQIVQLGWDCQAFVGADLRSLCTASALKALEDYTASSGSQVESQTGHQLHGHQDVSLPQVHYGHVVQALKTVRPSAMKSIAVEIPTVLWTDIGGYDDVKQKLKESVEWPITYREIFSELKVSPPRGILLYGPPGCSKTLLAKAVATESKMNFIAVKGPELFSKYVGDSEKAVRHVFRKARQNSPCVIFFDEIDSLGADRASSSGGGSGVESRVLSQMLNEMDGIGALKQVIVIGATNRPDLLDGALLRPGRLDRLVYVPLPDRLSREKVFSLHLRHLPLQRLPATDRHPNAEETRVPECSLFEGFSEPHSASPRTNHLSDACTRTDADDVFPLSTSMSAIKRTDVDAYDGCVLDPNDGMDPRRPSDRQASRTHHTLVGTRHDGTQDESMRRTSGTAPQRGQQQAHVDALYGDERERARVASTTTIQTLSPRTDSQMTVTAATDQERLHFIEELSKRTEGYSGAEIAMLCREAGMIALRERIEKTREGRHSQSPAHSWSITASDDQAPQSGGGHSDSLAKCPNRVMITWMHMMQCLAIVKPRIKMSLIEFYENYQNQVTI